MTRQKSPSMPLYGKDAWDDERFALLDWDEQGLFWRLAWWQWQEGSIPDDVDRIIALVGKPKQTRKLWPVVRQFFSTIAEGRIANRRLADHRDARQAFGEKQRANSLRGGGRPKNPTVNPNETQTVPKENPTVNPNENPRARTLQTQMQKESTSLETNTEQGIGSGEGACLHWQIVEFLVPLIADAGLSLEPTEQIIGAWVTEYGEELIAETLLDCGPEIRGKGYRYLEKILTTRHRNPSQRPAARKAQTGTKPDLSLAVGKPPERTPDQLRESDRALFFDVQPLAIRWCAKHGSAPKTPQELRDFRLTCNMDFSVYSELEAEFAAQRETA